MNFTGPLVPGVSKIPISLSFLGETDWNRVWSTLLHEKESVLHNSFSVEQYVTEERRKVRTCQVSSDPLIMDQKLLDRVRNHVLGTVSMQGREPIAKAQKSLGR